MVVVPRRKQKLATKNKNKKSSFTKFKLKKKKKLISSIIFALRCWLDWEHNNKIRLILSILASIFFCFFGRTWYTERQHRKHRIRFGFLAEYLFFIEWIFLMAGVCNLPVAKTRPWWFLWQSLLVLLFFATVILRRTSLIATR